MREQIDNPELVYFIQDARGTAASSSFRTRTERNGEKEFQQTRQKASRNSLKHGIVIEKTDADTDFTIVTFAPKHIANQIVEEVQANHDYFVSGRIYPLDGVHELLVRKAGKTY